MNIAGYRIESLIAKGGMATVYRAIQESLNRPVALKVMNPMLADAAEYAERFVNEATILAALSHNNIITIHDVGMVDDWLYLAMEYIEGGDLGRLIAAGVVAPEATLDLVEALGGCLQFAHDAGIIHRDVKPANILFRRDGTPLLTDFGIAKRASSQQELTLAGTILGSPYYLSPEQARGEPVTGQADIYSLGIVCYEMLTGQKPFQGDTDVGTMLKHLSEPPPQLTGTLAGMQPLLDQMLAKNPAERFRDAATLVAFARQLRGELQGRLVAREPARRSSAAGASYCVDEITADDQAASKRAFYQIYQDYMADRLKVPSMPDVAIRIRKAVEQPDINVDDLTKVIQADPSLAAYLVRVAKSPLFAGNDSVQSPHSAIVRLGMGVTRDMVTSFTLRNLFTSRAPAVKQRMREVWRHSCVVAALSFVLARLTPGIDKEQGLLAGLLHDVGALVLLAHAESYPELVADGAQLDGFLTELGGQIGAMVLRRWEFPDEFVAVPLEAENWERDSGPKIDLSDVVMLSRLHSFMGTPRMEGLPRIDSLPAFHKLTVSELTPDLSLQVLQEAQQELTDLRRLLQA
jgi:HD-like signal output (HDOD) protein/tRNA A-37 threonylcarbamoyl transferase component Bud32